MEKSSRTDNREAILAAARTTVQKDGYNALSFRDLASEVGVKSSSVHYYFPTKTDLAEALMTRYCDDFAKVMEPHSDKPFDEAIDAYLDLFRVAFDGSGRMCLGGMMAAEVSAMSPPTRDQIARFTNLHMVWIRGTLVRKHPRMPADQLDAKAKAIFFALEGAMLMVRGQGGDVAMFEEIVETYKASGLLA
jgi:TetR/AcrR family transcriptional repressor of nem operon